jgi:hypothetical protein
MGWTISSRQCTTVNWILSNWLSLLSKRFNTFSKQLLTLGSMLLPPNDKLSPSWRGIWMHSWSNKPSLWINLQKRIRISVFFSIHEDLISRREKISYEQCACFKGFGIELCLLHVTNHTAFSHYAIQCGSGWYWWRILVKLGTRTLTNEYLCGHMQPLFLDAIFSASLTLRSGNRLRSPEAQMFSTFFTSIWWHHVTCSSTGLWSRPNV